MKDKPTILIVDDEIKNIKLQKAYLKPYNCEILTASNGEKAIKIAAGNKIDLILLDVMMPGKNGFAVTKYLKSYEKTYGIPVILVTALSEKAEKVKGIEAGCDDFISKPVDSSELLAKVRSLLKVKAYNDHMRNYEQELETEVARRTKELTAALVMIEETALETIHRLVAAAECRDQYTGSHILRMSRYAEVIAEKRGVRQWIRQSPDLCRSDA